METNTLGLRVKIWGSNALNFTVNSLDEYRNSTTIKCYTKIVIEVGTIKKEEEILNFEKEIPPLGLYYTLVRILQMIGENDKKFIQNALTISVKMSQNIS